MANQSTETVGHLYEVQLAEYRRWGEEDTIMQVDSRHFTTLVNEIERLQLLVADYGGQLAALTARTVAVPTPTDDKDPTPAHLRKQGYRSGHT